MYYLITGLGTILADFQEGLAKTNRYAYKLVLSHKVKKRLIPVLPAWLFQQVDTRWVSENVKINFF
jgi:hypothetical protein